MLKIRKEQYEELGKISLKRFEDSMVEHIKEFFPNYYEIYEEPTIRKVIQYGIDRAENYGFTTERNVSLYVNLMFMLGSNFDVDPQLPWVVAILKDQLIIDPSTRIDRLSNKALDYLDRVAGSTNEHLGRALLRIRQIPVEEFSRLSVENIEDNVASQLKEIWPSKYRDIGRQNVHNLIRHSIATANNYNVKSERGIVIFTVLMFMLGSGFDTDPQFQWTAASLKDKAIAEQTTGIDRVYKEAMTFLEKWLARIANSKE